MEKTHDFDAIKKWNATSKEFKDKILNNAYCSECGVISIVNYSITTIEYGILLAGTCSKCGRDVARVVEDN